MLSKTGITQKMCKRLPTNVTMYDAFSRIVLRSSFSLKQYSFLKVCLRCCQCSTNKFHAAVLLFQASFENKKLVLLWVDDSGETLFFTLLYKHENDRKFQTVSLKNKSKGDSDKADEYRGECIIPDPKAGKYTCKIQSKCNFGTNDMSNEISVWNTQDVGFLVLCLLHCSLSSLLTVYFICFIWFFIQVSHTKVMFFL